MRPLTALACAALLPAALVAAPAQAAGGTLTVSWSPSNNPSGSLKITASAGIGPFAEAEELQISMPTANSVRIRILDGDHTLTPTNGCVVGEVGGDPAKDLRCTWNGLPPKPAVTVDLAAATGATTTAVIAGAFAPALTFLGGSGPDYVQGASAADEILGGPGDDDLFGGPGNDKISGDAGADNIDGEEGNDSVGGGFDDDFVVGGDGADSITGGPGVDDLDSRDQFQDTFVSCDNAPGQGKIDYDKGLDIPFDCPVVLPPTAPRDVTLDGGPDSITVNWAPPAFDGNGQALVYEIQFNCCLVTAFNVATTIKVDGTESSYTIPNLTKGVYKVTMRAGNEVGESPDTTPMQVSVGSAVSPPPLVDSVYVSRGNATLSWVEPVEIKTPRYEIALRVKDKNHKKWLAWQMLPGRQDVSSMDVGDDLGIVKGRIYQFRVRTVLANGESSAWTNSAVRFVGDLTPPTSGKLTRVGKSSVFASFNLTGLAWTYNVTVPSIYADLTTADYYYGISSKFATVKGSSYYVTMAGLPSINRTSDCALGVGYLLPGRDSVQQLWSSVACPAT